MRALIMSVVLLMVALPVQAQGPDETVNWIYTSLQGMGPDDSKGLAYLSSPAQRGTYFSERMVAFFDANDSYGANQMTACVDFALDVPGNDYNATEIARTLTVSSTGGNERKSVTASFSNFGQLSQITYDFIAAGGYWRIDDIAGPGWRVSQIACKPRGTSAPDTSQSDSKTAVPYTAGAASYCYMNADDTLKVIVAEDGSADFAMQSWQANGHSCSANGPARWEGAGWLYQGAGECRIEILITADQGLLLTDRDWACKPYLCGQRASIDGLTFARQTQVNCALLPSN